MPPQRTIPPETRPLQYLPKVEQAIGVQFFADPSLESIARTHPSDLEPHDLHTYGAIYMDGMRLLAKAQQQTGASPERLLADRERYFGAVYQPDVRALQLRLLRLAPIGNAAVHDAIHSDQLCAELGVDEHSLHTAVNALGILFVTLRRQSREALGSLHVPRKFVERLHTFVREQYAELLAMPSAMDIADACNTDPRTVRRQLRWRGYGQDTIETFIPVRQVRLPEKLAAVIMHDLQIIVPDEYLTPHEYVQLRGRNLEGVKRVIEKQGIPLHEYTVRERTVKYLDGGAIYELDQILRQRERRKPKADPPCLTIPEVRPPGIPGHLTTTKELQIITGLTVKGVSTALARAGVPKVKIIVGGRPNNCYPQDQLLTVLPHLPKTEVPSECISFHDLLLTQDTSEGMLRIRLRQANIRRAGSYLSKTGRVGAYYRISELSAKGIRLPSPIAAEEPTKAPPAPLPAELLPRGASTDHLILLDKFLSSLPVLRRPTRRQALEFITNNGGRLTLVGNPSKRVPYISGVAAGLIRYNYQPELYKPQQLGRGWFNRHELAARTAQSVAQIDADLDSVDWGEIRKDLQPMRTRKEVSLDDRPGTRATVHFIWATPRTGDTIVLPHYNPAIVARIEAIARERRAKKLSPESPRP